MNFHALLDVVLVFGNDCFPEGFDESGLFVSADLHFEEFLEVELEFLNLFEAILLSLFFECEFGFLFLFHIFEQLFLLFEFAQVDIHEFVKCKFLPFENDCRKETDDTDHLLEHFMNTVAEGVEFSHHKVVLDF